MGNTQTTPNQKPVLKLPKVEKAGVGQELVFSVSANDTDANQQVVITIIKKPENATFAENQFKWTPALSDTGEVTLIFTATDNGSPVITVTDSLKFIVTATPVNRAPKWNPSKMQRTIAPAVPFSLDVSPYCSDPDNDSLTFSLKSESPVKDTIVGKIYQFTPSVSDTGKYSIHIIAADPSKLVDTFTFELTGSNSGSSTADKVPPVILFKSPSKDTIISVDSCEIKVSCIDDSGCSVKGYRDGTPFDLKKSASTAYLWTGMVKGLTAGNYSIIKVVATDSSTAKNMDSLSVRIKYDNDKTGPVITLVTPIKDGVTTSSSSYTIVIKVSDPSGILSVNGASGTTTYPGVKDTASTWKINISTLENNKVTAVVITAVDSSYNANKTLDTVYIKSEIKNGYTITFDKNDNAATGTMSKQIINNGDSAYLIINEFTKTGWIFEGWGTSPTGTVTYKDGAIYKMGTSDVTLYAKWSAKIYNITFNKNDAGATGTMSAQPISVGSSSALTPITFSKTGATFAGWAISPAGDVVYEDKAVYTMGASDVILYAKWTAKIYNITFDKNDAGATGSMTDQSIASGAIAPLKPIGFSKTGYSFDGWATSSTGTVVYEDGGNYTMGTADDTLFAKWKVNTFQLTVSAAAGGSITAPATSPVTVNYGAATTITAAASTGYTFAGWTVTAGSATLENASAFTTTVLLISGNATVRADFTANPVTLTLINDGHGTTTPASSASGSYGVPINISASPSTGYSFSSWILTTGTATFGNATQATTTVTLSSNASIKANFSPNPLTLTMSNDGHGTTNPATSANASYGIATSISATPATGYEFYNWSVTTGTATIGDLNSASTTVTLTTNTTVKANFKVITCRITYNSNNGTGTVPVDDNSYSIGNAAVVKPNSGALVSGSSSFAGWSTTNGATYACGQTITITGDVTLYAKYSTTEVMDNDGNLYTSILIGGKRWLLQNLKTTKYRDGSAIPFVTSGAAWRTNAIVIGGPVCAWADFNSSNTNFGLLYNWAAVQNREIGPAGWRTPTEAEWTALQSDVTSNCDLLSNWSGNCSDGQNSSGFSLFESGDIYQNSEDEQAYYSNSGARLWGATDIARSSPAFARLQGVPGGVGFWIDYDTGFPFRANGFSVRCVKE